MSRLSSKSECAEFRVTRYYAGSFKATYWVDVRIRFGVPRLLGTRQSIRMVGVL